MTGMYLANSFGPQQRKRVDAGEYAGWFVSPYTRGVPSGVQAGQEWAGDNGCFSQAFTPDLFAEFMGRYQVYAGRCLFIVVPDVVGDPWATLDRWQVWRERVGNTYPVAFAGQDGCTSTMVPWDELSCYFVGGTDEWKDGGDSLALVSEARDREIRVHLGRGNTRPRLEAFWKAYKRPGDGPILPGFTFDGNGLRYPGKDRELAPARAILQQEFLL